MATCPACGVHSLSEPGALVIDEVLVGSALGTFSLSGSQMKVPARAWLRLKCRCGWYILGTVVGEYFEGVASTEVFPPDTERPSGNSPR